jgi:hypothetical protein
VYIPTVAFLELGNDSLEPDFRNEQEPNPLEQDIGKSHGRPSLSVMGLTVMMRGTQEAGVPTSWKGL